MIYYTRTSSGELKQLDNRIDAAFDFDYYRLFFHDDVFTKVDWTIEPQESLMELYRKRAEQIRSDYEYVVLAYSGGIDSQYVLESFYYNNIHIDEILLVGAFSQDSAEGVDENHNAEIFKNALPIINSLNLENTIITKIDYTQFFDDVNNFSLIQKYGSDWVRYIGSYFSPHNLFWHDVDKFIRKNDKKTALVLGIEKPIFFIEDNRYATHFRSDTLDQYGDFQKNDNFERVNFYTSVDTIDLMKKQLHLIKNFYHENVVLKKTMTSVDFWNHYALIQSSLIYPKKRHQMVYSSPKSPSNLLSLRDSYLLNKTNEPIFKIYSDGIQKIKGIIKNGKWKRIEPFLTRTYYLS